MLSINFDIMKDLHAGAETQKFSDRFEQLMRYFSISGKNISLKKGEAITFSSENVKGIFLVVSGAIGFQVQGAGQSICRIKFGIGRILGGLYLDEAKKGQRLDFFAECETQLIFLERSQYKSISSQFPELSLLLLEEAAMELNALQGLFKYSLQNN